MELYSVVKKETIRKSIGIGASKEKVWQVLFDERYLPIWYAEFSLGMVGKVVVNRPCTKLSVEYLGLMVTGEEDYNSDQARAMQGGHEQYNLEEKEGTVLLSVETDMPQESYDSMALATLRGNA